MFIVGAGKLSHGVHMSERKSVYRENFKCLMTNKPAVLRCWRRRALKKSFLDYQYRDVNEFKSVFQMTTCY
jgi:hypothetical protein